MERSEKVECSDDKVARRLMLLAGGVLAPLWGGLFSAGAYLRGGVSLGRAIAIAIVAGVSLIVLCFALTRVAPRFDQLEPRERSDWVGLGLYCAATAGLCAVFLGLTIGIARIAYLMGTPFPDTGFCARFLFTWHWLHAVLIGVPPVVSAIQVVRKWPQTAANAGVQIRHL